MDIFRSLKPLPITIVEMQTQSIEIGIKEFNETFPRFSCRTKAFVLFLPYIETLDFKSRTQFCLNSFHKRL